MKKSHFLGRFAALMTLLAGLILPALSMGQYDFASHIPHDGDQLHPDVSAASNAVMRIDSARTVCFIPGMFFPMDETDAAVYADADTISYVQLATRHVFSIHNDSLLYLGYQNRAANMQFDTPVAIMSFDLGHEKIITDDWRGTLMLHGRRLLKNTVGSSLTDIQRGWKVTDGNDTIHNATYAVWNLEMSYVNSDSIPTEATDSLISEIASDLSLPSHEVMTGQLLTKREMWFAEDARYPILQMSRVFQLKSDEDGSCDTIPVSVFAMHYPPAYQSIDTGREPTRGRAQGEKNDFYNTTDYNTSDNITGLYISDATLCGTEITVTISSETPDYEIFVTLYSDSGIRLSEKTCMKAGILPRQFSIPAPETYRGVMVLLIESDGMNTSRKIIL